MRVPILLVALLGVLWTGMLACAIAGLIVWSGLCTGPSAPNTSHTVPHSCHGTVVYGTPLADDLWNWILPCVFLVLFAASTAVVIALKIRIARAER